MSDSLRDQLLKAGLITEGKVKSVHQAEEQRRRQLKSAGKRQPRDAPPSAAQQEAAKKAARDLELNRRQQAAAQHRAIGAQVEQLIEQARLPRLESDQYYSFVDGRKVCRIAVDAQRRSGISGGKLAIVRYKGFYEVVPAAAAQTIRERDGTAVIALDRDQKTAPEDDPYRDFVVPDDLTW
jgi:hypothetical protein